MSLTVLPDGRCRAQVHDPRTGRNVSVGKILGDTSSIYASKRIAKRKREQARELLETRGHDGPTLKAFAYRWTTDQLFSRPKVSTDMLNHWAIKDFVAAYGDLPIRHITHDHVAEYLAGGNRSTRIPSLRAMFSDAGSREAGRLIDANPFTGLRLRRTRGNQHAQPASEAMVWSLITNAREQAGPAFSAWLQVACFTGLRPGELDALKWSSVDFTAGSLQVVEQYNSRSRTITAPKNGLPREAILTDQARTALLSVPRTSEYCFVAPRGGHYTPAARRAPWERTRTAAGWDRSLYLATRHFAGWYMVNVLLLDSEDVAFALGHEDGGQQVRKTYGHRERRQGLERVRAAYAARSAQIPHTHTLRTAV